MKASDLVRLSGARILYKPTKNEPVLFSFIEDITFFYSVSLFCPPCIKRDTESEKEITEIHIRRQKKYPIGKNLKILLYNILLN